MSVLERVNEIGRIICYDVIGEHKMKNEILINDILKELDNFLLDFDAFYAIKRINREILRDSD